MKDLLIYLSIFVMAGAAYAERNTALAEHVLTKEQQQALTPATALEILKQGNQRFVAGELTVRDHQAQVRAAVSGQ